MGAFYFMCTRTDSIGPGEWNYEGLCKLQDGPGNGNATIYHMDAGFIDELKKRGIEIPVIVGGAVITKDYASSIGAAYSKDAIVAIKEIKKILK